MRWATQSRSAVMQSSLAALRPAVALGLAITIVASGAAAQPYPAKPIRILSPFSAGSPPDAMVRLVSQQMSERLGQGVTIENRPGGGTTIATKAGAAADPDGYTLLQVSTAVLYTPVLYPNAGYDPLKSFTPVAGIAGWSHVLVVPASVPANTVAELIAAAKAKPGELNIGFSLGTSPQILAEIFKSAAGAPLNSVPYRQVAQLNADILAGRLQAWFTAGAGSISLIQQGKLKALAYTGATRHPALPQVPTMIESGLPQLALGPSDWTGLVAPAATPKDAVDKLNAAIGASLRSPAVNANITQQGYEPMIRSPQELAAFLAAEATKWPPLVRAAGMQPE